MLTRAATGDDLWRLAGRIWPLGIPTSLSWYDIGALLHLIGAIRPGFVLEIGAQYGGLSCLLASYSRHVSMIYIGIDCTIEQVHRAVWAEDREYLLERDAWDAATVDEVRGWMNAAPPPCLIICDGGDKARDLHTYAPLLRDGDVIMAHDYPKEIGNDDFVGLPEALQWFDPPWLHDTTWWVFTCGVIQC